MRQQQVLAKNRQTIRRQMSPRKMKGEAKELIDHFLSDDGDDDKALITSFHVQLKDMSATLLNALLDQLAGVDRKPQDVGAMCKKLDK